MGEPLKVNESYDFFKMSNTVDTELGFEQAAAGKHFYPDSIDFDEWHKKKGYPKKDIEGKYLYSSSVWFKEFQEEVQRGIIKEVPFLNFWHWQVEHCFKTEVRNPCHNFLNVSKEIAENEEEWIQVLQNKWNELFSPYADEDGFISVYISW